MESPLHPEAANADLITDIVAASPESAADVSELAHDLADESSSWRRAWAIGAPEPEPVDDRPESDPSAPTT